MSNALYDSSLNPNGKPYGYIGTVQLVDGVDRAPHRLEQAAAIVVVDALVAGRFKFEEPQNLRGIPLVGGGPGVVAGTHPEHETVRRDMQRRRIRA